MNMTRAWKLAILFAVLCRGAVFAQAADPFVFDFNPAIWGADIGVGYKGAPLASGVDTIFWIYGGGSYEEMRYQRMPDGELITGEAPDSVRPSEDITYNRGSLRWRLGVAQGLEWNERTGANLLEAFFFYRGRRDWNLEDRDNQLVFLSDIPDRKGILQNALLMGVSFNDLVRKSRHKTPSGMSAEFSFEWGPAFFLNTEVGKSDYARFNLNARAFFPLYDAAPDSAANVLSVYVGDFVSVDYAFGPDVPLNIRQTFGGLDPRVGLGGALRGVDEGSLDTNLKLVNNLDLRVNLPAVWSVDVVPGILVYWDAGYYDQVGESGVDRAGGFVSSLGGGIFVNIMDISSITVYTHYRFTGVNADGSKFTPLEFHYNLRF